ncbi:hypothetical protein BH18ACI4_BH18ACI4_23660 [soil metagenome]
MSGASGVVDESMVDGTNSKRVSLKYYRSEEGTCGHMALSKEEAIQKARYDLAERLGVGENDIESRAVEAADFPDTALGASVADEMSGQMITPGWRIKLRSNGQTFEYRANAHQVRLYNYQGGNYRI